MSLVDPQRDSSSSQAGSTTRGRLWRSFLAGFASLDLFPQMPPREDPAEPWEEMWKDIRSDWESVGQDIRNAADRLSS